MLLFLERSILICVVFVYEELQVQYGLTNVQGILSVCVNTGELSVEPEVKEMVHNDIDCELEDSLCG